jgi:hypothetical protein
MKTWASMYLVIWVSFLQVLFILFTPFGTHVGTVGYDASIGIHAVLGLAVLALAFQVYRGVMKTGCPDRIKRITKTTRNLAVFQAVLGIALALGYQFSLGLIFTTVISFLHVANALAIITQASSSATGYDMWEEKEFQVPTATT